MFNFIILSLIFLVAVSGKILLLNEETLVLICFILFCWITYNKFSESIYYDLKSNAVSIETSLKTSMNHVIVALEENVHWQKNNNTLSTKFKLLRKHLLKLILSIIQNFPQYSIQNSNLLYSKKLLFTLHLEQQTTKLIALLILRKLEKIILVRQFCIQTLQISYFQCFYKVIFREYLEIL